MRKLVATLMLFGGTLVFYCRGAEQPGFRISRPTVLAFFPPVSQQQLERDPDTNEALADFQVYASRVREPLLKLGVDFKEVYARSFRITIAGKTTTFRPGAPRVGYYFVVPGKKPRIQYGVDTDDGIIGAAKDYFGLNSR